MGKVFIIYLMLDDMNNGSSAMDGSAISLICAIIGGVIIAVGAWYGTKKNYKVQKLDDEERIEALNATIKEMRETITDLDIENKRKQDSIEKMAFELLDFSNRIDSSTTLTEDLVKKIGGLTNSTKKITQQIKNEQQQRGTLNFDVQIKDEYSFGIGTNLFVVPRSSLEQGFQVYMPGLNLTLPIFLKLIGNKMYLTTRVLNLKGNLSVEIKDNNWNLNKNSVFSINFDDKGLEVIDEQGFINLQIDFVDSNFSIKMLRYEGRDVVFINDSGIRTLTPTKDNFQEFVGLANSVKPIFRHYGENYINQRLK